MFVNRSRSAADVLHPMSSNASSNDQVRRFEEERIALLQTKSLRKSTEVKSMVLNMISRDMNFAKKYTGQVKRCQILLGLELNISSLPHTDMC